MLSPTNGGLSDQHLVGGATGRVDVDAGVGLAAGDHLGREVGRCAGGGMGRDVGLGHHDRDAEVEHLDEVAATAVLDRTMLSGLRSRCTTSCRVRGRERLAHLTQDRDDPRRARAGPPAAPRRPCRRSSSSITKSRRPSGSSAKSLTSAMCSEPMRRDDARLVAEVRVTIGLRQNSGRSTLSATRRSMSTCSRLVDHAHAAVAEPALDHVARRGHRIARTQLDQRRCRARRCLRARGRSTAPGPKREGSGVPAVRSSGHGRRSEREDRRLLQRVAGGRGHGGGQPTS